MNEKKILSITKRAIIHLKNYLKKNKSSLGFCISLTKYGCSGFSYSIRTSEFIFDKHTKIIESDLEFYLEKKFINHLIGLEIDYDTSALGGSKLIYSNSNEKAKCGCGKSFSINKI